ncbi:MAG TPA: XVIPCD domain-containing protein [Rhodanobacter sp.]|nr:XVIPCD domain-containing protein [Rhodanobacter sp.]
MTKKDKFIAELYPAAVKISQETGMSKELILAQAAQETGWGQHVLAGTHNIFNIKASADWSGPTRTFKVWEIEDGRKIWEDQDFRVYESTVEALRDRVRFLQENPRYAKAGLFDEGTKGNFAEEAAALQQAGYATDPLYAKHLVAVYYGPTMQNAIRQAQVQGYGSILEQGGQGDAVHALQTTLTALGYSDVHGHPLEADGDFGSHTRFAVKAFQRDHQLVVDGKVGSRTQQALDLATRSKTRLDDALLDDLRHPDHALYQQALEGVRKIDLEIGRPSDTRSENLAAALTVAARRQGLDRIDQVVLSKNGERAFALAHGQHARMAHVQTADAARTSMAESSTAWTQANQQATCSRVLPQAPPSAQASPAMGR